MNILLCFILPVPHRIKDLCHPLSHKSQPVGSYPEQTWGNHWRWEQIPARKYLGYKLSLRAVTQTAQRCSSENPKSQIPKHSLACLTSSRVLSSTYIQIPNSFVSSTFQRILKILKNYFLVLLRLLSRISFNISRAEKLPKNYKH